VSDDWRPTAGLAALQGRAALLAEVRAFFAAAGVLEVETPLCASAAGTDPALRPLRTRYTGPGHPQGLTLYLQTSPEFAMKRLLAAGSGPIYQVCKAFRDGEAGGRHNPEFTLLEWYRPGFDQHRLMDEVAALVRQCLGAPQLGEERISYRELFLQQLQLDPLVADPAQLQAIATARIPGSAGLQLPDRDAWLDLLLSALIEPRLGNAQLTFVFDYPASQAALARLDAADPRAAARFELYYRGMELANGFHELGDADELRARFVADNAERRAAGEDELPLDERLLAALAHGLPDCAGVALGLDRLLMLKLGAERIAEVLAFPVERA
jgi:lysyl-tRNA synthetase class 2